MPIKSCDHTLIRINLISVLYLCYNSVVLKYYKKLQKKPPGATIIPQTKTPKRPRGPNTEIINTSTTTNDNDINLDPRYLVTSNNDFDPRNVSNFYPMSTDLYPHLSPTNPYLNSNHNLAIVMPNQPQKFLETPKK